MIRIIRNGTETEKMMLYHSIPPVFDGNSRVLMLGSFPSPKSREAGFFYGHPQNRFWKVLSAVLERAEPVTVAEKRDMLLSRGIALWDVLSSCEIVGASDATIRSASVNDFSKIYDVADIRAVFATGQTAAKLYRKLTGKPITALPSTSPANCARSLDDLIEEYRVILKYL